MIFGAKTEKTGQLFPQPPPAGSQGAAAPAPPPKRRGHGRRAAGDYPGAKLVKVPHPQLHPGDPCPDCKQGKLCLLKGPAQIVRITAQSLFAATRFELEKLRCKLCGRTFTAPAPPEAGLEKNDPNVGPTPGYKTQNGARLGDLFMSLIHTCRLCAGNPPDDLNALQRHAKEARQHPTRWFPWNYKQALPADDTG
jgi:hypothetical protein